MTSPEKHLAHPKYRPDIDGLRAVAVLSVVFFHAFPTLLPGGFIGVDVFFVISGFLISSIIFQSLEKGTFSFREFYARRIRRIFPSLIVILTTCFAFGWFVLLPDEYKQLGKHIAAGAAFVSNFILWGEAGYFDNAGETKPLLHLWSLGIEEQFYIVWPLLLWIFWKTWRNLLPLTLIVLAGSFLLNLTFIERDAIGTFYSPLSRFWELLFGSVLAWYSLHNKAIFVSAMSNHRYRNLFSICGIFLIGLGFGLIDKSRAFPGFWALLPVAGSLFIIASGPQAFFNRVLLSSKPLVWFGLISFPLYLWHWPLLSYARIIASENPSPTVRSGAVILAIILAWLTYRFLERPIRNSKSFRTTVFVPIILMLAIGIIGFSAFQSNGFPLREVVAINTSVASGEDGGPNAELINECGINNESIKAKFAHCLQDKRRPVKYALIGDSKAAALFAGIFRTSTDQGRWLFIGGNGPNGTPLPAISNNTLYKQYQPLATTAIAAVAQNNEIDTVVLVGAARAFFQLSNDTDIEDLPNSGNFDAALEALLGAVNPLLGYGKKVVLLVDNPTLPHPEDCLYRKTTIPLVNKLLVKENPKCTLSLERHLALSEKYLLLLKTVKNLHPTQIEIFDPTLQLCDPVAGTCKHSRDGRFLYSYSDHLSDYAAGLIGHNLNERLNTLNR